MKANLRIRYSYLFIFFLFAIFGCSQKSAQEEKSKKERDEILLKEEEKERDSIRIAQLCDQYNAIYFPTSDIDGFSNSLTIQKFLKDNSKIVFKGFFEDIYEENGGVIVSISCLLSDFFYDKSAIIFNLKNTNESVTHFENQRKTDQMLSFIKYTNREQYLIICDCISIQKVGSSKNQNQYSDDEQDLELKVNFIVNGNLLKVEKY